MATQEFSSTGQYRTEPCLKAECFDDGELIGPHYHSVDPDDSDFIMKVSKTGEYL